MNLRTLFRDIAVDMLNNGRTLIPDDVVKAAERQAPEMFADEGARLVRQAAKREVKDVLRTLTEDDDDAQLKLPGLGFPSVIAIPVEGEYVYKPSALCEWAELQAGRTSRTANVRAAQAKLDKYEAELDRVQPFMEGTGRKLHEVARLIAEAAA